MIIFLAGAESFLDLVKEVKPHAILMSYYYLREKGIGKDELKELSKFAKIFIDSGGFTFRVKHKVDSIPRTYIDEYGTWLQENERYLFGYANVDVLDIEETKQNQKILEDEFGLNPIPVWHYGEPFNVLREYCEIYDYVCLGGFAGSGEKGIELENRVLQSLKKAKSYNDGIKLHVFGYSGDLRTISKFAYSCDVTSWIAGRYGVVSEFKNGRIEGFHWKEDVLRLVKIAKQYGLDVERAKQGDYKVLNEISMREWKKAQEYYEGNNDMTEVKVIGFGCKVCPVADKCAYYNENAEECRLVNEKLSAIRDDEGIMEDIIKFVIEERLRRYVRARIFEELEGGVLDKHVTTLEDGIAKLIEMYLKLKYPERYSGKVVATQEQDFDEILRRLEEYEESE